MTQCLSSNDGLENGDRELGHLSATTGAVKTLRLYTLSKCTLCNRYFKSALLLHHLVALWWDTRPFWLFRNTRFFRCFFCVEVGLACSGKAVGCTGQ